MKASQDCRQAVCLEDRYPIAVSFCPSLLILKLFNKRIKVHEDIRGIKNPVTFRAQQGSIVSLYFHKSFFILMQELYPQTRLRVSIWFIVHGLWFIVELWGPTLNSKFGLSFMVYGLSLVVGSTLN